MKINEIHWFLKFVIGVAVGMTVGYFTDMNLGLVLGILLGTAFAQGTRGIMVKKSQISKMINHPTFMGFFVCGRMGRFW